MVSSISQIEEYVMVIPTDIIYSVGFFQGLSFDTEAHMKIINDLKSIKFLKRSEVETDPNYKQIIPYAVFIHGNVVFSYQRGKLLNEKRLQGDYSIGIGGHISANDLNLFEETYLKGMFREVVEEVEIDTKYSQRVVALLNDDSNEVGKVHFGIVHLFDLEKPLVRAKEKSINKGKFLGVDQLKENINKYENWSRICISHIYKLINEKWKSHNQ